MEKVFTVTNLTADLMQEEFGVVAVKADTTQKVITEMALSPKSNSAHVALDEALNDIRRGSTGNVPDHIKTNSTTYLYPHNYKNSYVKQEYLPANLKGKKYYHPRDNKYENNLNKLWHEMKGE